MVALPNDRAERVLRLPEPLPEIGWDRNDDDVIGHAVIAKADYLVRWNKGLRDWRKIESVRIVGPPESLQTRRETGRLSE